jgi:serine protein kinase
MDIFKKIKENYSQSSSDITLLEYLELCRNNSEMYASPAERILRAIGEPTLVDTKDDPRLSRIHTNKVIKQYPAFKDFFGMEDTIEQIVGFFKHAAQGLEEKKQILYLLGPVGGGKSSLAERLKQLMEESYIYVLCTDDEVSPIYESPLGLFSQYKDSLLEYGISKTYIPSCASPWATKRLQEFEGDLTKFKVKKMKLSIQGQIGIAKTEPGDESNQDISTLVGKIDIRKLAEYPQNDTDAYNYSGSLCRANQGIMEFVEMFKAPIKVLHPLLTATQEGNYNGTENIPAIPYQGIILAHSNESEWDVFSNDKKNEAFLDRVYIVRVPYCLRIDDEVKIYEKLLSNSTLSKAPCAPKTLELLAQFAILTRIKQPENSSIYSKMRIYNGENLKDIDPKAKSLQEYRDDAGVSEGMEGISTRFAFKILSKVFNYSDEVAANPVHLFLILEQEIIKLQLSQDTQNRYLALLKASLIERYASYIGDEIQKAFIDSYSEYGQNIFERYVLYADHWCNDDDYRDPETNTQFNRNNLNDELEKIEKTAGISNPKDFRQDVVNFYLRHKAANSGEAPRWDSYNKIKNVIEKRLFSNTEDILPIISFTAKANKEDEKKHSDFVKRMVDRGYTEKQIRLLTEWHIRIRKNN